MDPPQAAARRGCADAATSFGAVSTDIRDHARRVLWGLSGGVCAFPECDQHLVEPNPENTDSTVLAVECHIVAQKDSLNVSRSPSSLTPEEQERYAFLLANRHHERNLVLMCLKHSRLIDDPNQPYSVERVLEIKYAHEARQRERDPQRFSDPGGIPASAISNLLSAIGDPDAWDRKAMRELLAAHPEAAVWLQHRLGAPESKENVEQLIADWPRCLADGPYELLVALIRKAELHARHDLASLIWERLANRATGPVRADRLTRASIDAAVAGDPDREKRLLKLAESEHPDCVRALVQRIDDMRPPAEQLADLAPLSSEDDSLQALIELHRARCYLLVPDLEASQRHYDIAAELDIDSINLKAMSICIRLQRARLAVHEDAELALAEAEEARADALALRERLQSMARWEESGRMLMMATDLHMAVCDAAGAARLIAEATTEELAAPDGAEVLGDAAIRAMAPDLAVQFVRGVPGDGAARIRATALIDRPGPERQRALEKLEAIALGAGREAEHAAAARLLACVHGFAYHERVADVLVGGPHERLAHSMRAIALSEASNHIAAEEAIEPHRSTPWGAALAVELALRRGNHGRLRETADALLAVGPDPGGRLLASRAFQRSGDRAKAVPVLVSVAHNPNAAPIIRSDAYALLLRCLADDCRWKEVTFQWTDWAMLSNQRLPRPDDRVSAWQVRVAHHARDTER